jgi:hypothetical protein
VLLHDLARDGEPEPGALRLGGEKLLTGAARPGAMPAPVSLTAISTVPASARGS